MPRDLMPDADFDHLMSRPYWGNYLQDGPYLSALASFFLDARNPTEQRVAAVKRMDEVMTTTPTYTMPDEELLARAVSSIKELLGEDFTTMYPHCD